MKRLEKIAAAEAEAKLFNERHPVGTEVRFWREDQVKTGPGRPGFTRSRAYVSTFNRAVILVKGHSGPVLISRVEPVTAGAGAPSPSPASPAA